MKLLMHDKFHAFLKRCKVWRGGPVDIIVAGPREYVSLRGNTLWHCDDCQQEACLASDTLAVMRKNLKAKVVCLECAASALETSAPR